MNVGFAFSDSSRFLRLKRTGGAVQEYTCKNYRTRSIPSRRGESVIFKMDTSIVASSDNCKCSALLNPTRLVYNLKTRTVIITCDACGETSIVGNENEKKGLPPLSVDIKPAKE